ncbi:SprB repeat-containing protein [Pontibacter beigongshangensis]|uniref:SprB repeat-containing protein n=1 Tax=Pontibacter beigongshangensis TaxID=2574733 RepID=UPI0016505AA8|nr:SprB repeat-containing protein [Pontibacter beigongshangensis]
MADTRQQIKAFIEATITDEYNRQNSAKVVRNALNYIVDNLFNSADDGVAGFDIGALPVLPTAVQAGDLFAVKRGNTHYRVPASAIAAYTGTGSTELAISSTQSNVSVYGASNGSITATASGGTSPYQFSLNNINYQTSGVFSNLPAGVYTVYVKDAANTVKSKAVTITQPAYQNASATIAINKTTGTTGTGESVTLTYDGSLGNETLIATNPRVLQYKPKGAAESQWTDLFVVGMLSGTYTYTEYESKDYRFILKTTTPATRASGTVTITFSEAPAPQATGYFGYKPTDAVLTATQIEAGSSVVTGGQANVAIDYTANTTPLFHWYAELATEPVKTKWQDIVNIPNNGAIGGDDNLFKDPVIVGAYRFYITWYQTQFAHTIELRA